LTEKSYFVLHFSVFSFQFLILSIKIVQISFIVCDFSACIHFISLNDCNLLISDLSFQVFNVDIFGSYDLGESFNLLDGNGRTILILTYFSLKWLKFSQSSDEFIILSFEILKSWFIVLNSPACVKFKLAGYWVLKFSDLFLIIFDFFRFSTYLIIESLHFIL